MYTSTQLAALSAALLALPSTYAHMIMSSPVPYGAPNNSPLDASGSDFPCKIGGSGSYDVTTMNEWAVGSQQTLSFTGSATHGGGSCQVSVTTDKQPTKGSKFKVIHSIEGGCPTSDGGNGGALNTFNFEVPKELPNGELTMAWTWFNKVGNREMYMNCAPITVSGGSDDTSGFDSLPDMATANIGGSSCSTSAGSDYTFANPGKSVERAGTGPFMEVCGGAASDGSSTGGSGSSGGGESAPPSEPAPEAPKEKTPPSGGSSAGGCTDGQIVCNGSSEFGICNGGSAVFQPVAAGTTCSNGQIMRKRYISYTHRAQRTAIP